MKDNVKLLGKQGITPEYVLHYLESKLGNTQEIFVVTYDRMGNPSIVFSGTLAGLKSAAFDLQRAANTKVETIQGRFDI